MDPIGSGHRSDKRYDNDQCREDVHQTPHDQEEEVQQDQEYEWTVSKSLEQIKQLDWDLSID